MKAPVSASFSLGARLAAGAVLLAAVLAAYWNTHDAPFIFDDIRGIVRNPSLTDFASALHPPDRQALSGRPVANLSFALNRALSGDAVWSYHAVNISIHALAALLIFGIVRRTLRRRDATAPAGEAIVTAGAVAFLWALHPLQTESVTFLVQRVESLMALFYLATLYAFVRATTSPRPRIWLAGSVVACALGMATKEVMVSAPLLVLLYDRTFNRGTFRQAWRARPGYYLALAATWAVLLGLATGGHGRTSMASFGASITRWDYLVTQGYAIPHYVRLALWPAGQVFDYGYSAVPLSGTVALELVALTLLFGATVWALVKQPEWGFLGAWFFAILGPSSSVVPLTLQPIAEHRIYLPLVALIVAFVAGLRLLGAMRALIILLVGALGMGVLTARRNADYRTALALWRDTVVKQPANARAWANLAHAYADAGNWEQAMAAGRRQLEADPRYVLDVEGVIGRSLLGLDRAAEALPHLRAQIALEPDNLDLRNNYAMALAAAGQLANAAEQYEQVLQQNPAAGLAQGNLANLLVKMGRSSEAWPHYATAAKIRPADPQMQINWGASLLEAGQMEEAIAHFRQALTSDAQNVPARFGLAAALAQTGKAEAAAAEYRRLREEKAAAAQAHLGLGDLAAQARRLPEAIGEYQSALGIDPTLVAAQHNLAVVLMNSGRTAEAIAGFERTLQALPKSATAHHELAVALAFVGRYDEARQQEKAALQLDPNLTEAREFLSQLERP